MISYCGITCTECPAYLATQANDPRKARETAEQWSRQFDTTITADQVWCDGCIVGGKKCFHCGECEIRACAVEQGVVNCAHCAEYACGKLTSFFAMAPSAKATLDAIQASL